MTNKTKAEIVKASIEELLYAEVRYEGNRMSVLDVYNKILLNNCPEEDKGKFTYVCGEGCSYGEECDNCPIESNYKELSIERWINI